MTTYLPVLGPEGWVSSGQKKLDMLMAHLYTSDASQTHFFNGYVSSLASVIKENQGKMKNAVRDIQEMLTRYFSYYFHNVEVIVYEYETDDFHRGELVMSAVMEDEFGVVFQLHEVMTKQGSVVRNVLDYQYEGEV